MELVLIRTAERLIAVIIGGLAIYLGYLLFQSVKATGESDVEVKLPNDTTVMLSRIGPGIFFALFGAAIVSASFLYPVEYQQDPNIVRIRGVGPSSSQPSPTTSTHISSDDSEFERLRVRQQMEFLNQLPQQLINPALSAAQRKTVERETLAMKLALMRSVWDKDWGRFEDFKLWAEGGAEATVVYS